MVSSGPLALTRRAALLLLALGAPVLFLDLVDIAAASSLEQQRDLDCQSLGVHGKISLT